MSGARECKQAFSEDYNNSELWLGAFFVLPPHQKKPRFRSESKRTFTFSPPMLLKTDQEPVSACPEAFWGY